jgi:oligopeptide transport system substrate-binding protein
MFVSARTLVALAATGGLLTAAGWSLSFGTLPPADFTFVNGTEIKSVDPAIVTGQPEGRIVQELFEGLVRWDPKTLEPQPAGAVSWQISPDGLVYTFQLRPEARWSDNTPVGADDFRRSFRRMLDPLTASEYSYQLWYIQNAKRYSTGRLEPGDAVEVELNERPAGALPFARGIVLKGSLVAQETAAKQTGPATSDTAPSSTTPPASAGAAVPTFVVRVGDRERRFRPGGGPNAEDCRQVLLDFDRVGIEVLDPLALRITLAQPTAYFLSLLGFYPLLPVQMKCVETHGLAWTRPENIVGNGPYRLKSRRIRDRLRLVRSETYWDRAHVQLAVVDALAVESPATALNLYLTGEADWITNVPPTITRDLIAAKRSDFTPGLLASTYFYRLNVTRPPLDNKLVRQALALSINRREVIDTVTRAGEQVALSFVPPGMPGYEPATTDPYDPAAARRLLAEAGYPEGRGFPKLTIQYNTDEAHQSIAELIQDRWKRDLGIRVDLQNLEWAAYLNSQRYLDYAISRAGWTGDYLDPNTFLDMFVSGGANNQTGWSSPEFDALIDAAAREPDRELRATLLHRAETILLDEAPIIPIYYRVSKNMVRPYVSGFYENLQDVHPLSALGVDAAERRQIQSGKGLR